MPHNRLKWGLSTFLFLSLLLAINLHAFQSGVRTNTAKRVTFPGSATETSAILAQQSVSGRIIVEPPVLLGEASASRALDRDEGGPEGSDLTRAVQRELQAKGYATGGIDGAMGLVTRSAIMAFEWDSGMALTAEPSDKLLERLVLGGGGATEASPGTPPGPKAREVIQSVQRSLLALGYGPIRTDGDLDEGTRGAIGRFEARQGMKESGRISGELVTRLSRLEAQARVADKR